MSAYRAPEVVLGPLVREYRWNRWTAAKRDAAAAAVIVGITALQIARLDGGLEHPHAPLLLGIPALFFGYRAFRIAQKLRDAPPVRLHEQGFSIAVNGRAQSIRYPEVLAITTFREEGGAIARTRVLTEKHGEIELGPGYLGAEQLIEELRERTADHRIARARAILDAGGEAAFGPIRLGPEGELTRGADTIRVDDVGSARLDSGKLRIRVRHEAQPWAEPEQSEVENADVLLHFIHEERPGAER